MHDVVALPRVLAHAAVCPWRRPDVDIDDMQPPLIHQHRDSVSVHRIQAGSGEWKSLSAEIVHRRRKIQLAVEPRLYSVLISRLHVRQMSWDQRTQVTIQDLLSHQLAGLRSRAAGHEAAKERAG